MLSTVEKVGQVFALFTPDHPEWGVSEVAEELGLPKSSAHALLSTLAAIDLLKRTGNARYRLGWRILALSQTLMETAHFRREARRWMSELVAEFGETVHMATLQLGRVVYTDKVVGTRAVRVELTGVGTQGPAHCSALGKVLLSDLTAERVREIVSQHGLPANTPNTITSLSELESELESVRRRGYAYDVGELMPELCCVAAPILGYGTHVIAAMSISVPAYRFDEYKRIYRRAIVEATRDISERMGDLGGLGPRKGKRAAAASEAAGRN
jgi:IclR family KDG regulon transcriptional repressor